MNHGDHSFIEITQQTMLRVALVTLVVSSESSPGARQARHRQNACARHVERVESCRVEMWRAKWNLGFNSLPNRQKLSLQEIMVAEHRSEGSFRPEAQSALFLRMRSTEIAKHWENVFR